MREYASFELERKGYDRAQVDAFLAELDQAFMELETSVKDRGNEVAQLQAEVERLKRGSPVSRGEEILKRAETNAEQMLASSLAEGQEIVAKAEAMAMRIIANARAQSQDLAAQPPGFGMLARVRTAAADIDRIKAEHAAVMEERPELLAPSEKIVTFEEPAVEPEAEKPQPKAAPSKTEPAAAKSKAAPSKTEPAAAKSKAAPSKTEPAANATEPTKKMEQVEEGVDEEEPIEATVPRIKLVEPPAVEHVAAKAADEIVVQAPEEVTVEAAEESAFEDEYDDVMLDPKAIDWGAARQEAIQVRGGDEAAADLPLEEPEEGPEEEPEEDLEAAAIAAAREKLPTVMRREGSRYERHSASLPKIGSEGESTLSDVSKVSKRRRRRAAYRDDEAL